MTCSLSSQISHARRRQPPNLTRRPPDCHPSAYITLNYAAIDAPLLVEFRQRITRTPIQNP
jgi:hypothetical protein